MWKPRSLRQLIWGISICSFLVVVGLAVASGSYKHRPLLALLNSFFAEEEQTPKDNTSGTLSLLPNGRPRLDPLPAAKEVWQCEVVVVGGSLGGVAAASQAMKSGARTCLIELTPWFGGQISSQGVSAIDESDTMIRRDNFSKSWNSFKQLIERQQIKLPAWSKQKQKLTVDDTNSCWVGKLCFPPKAGEQAARQLLNSSAKSAPGSRWGAGIAFKGAEFDATGKLITAIYGVRRIPRDRNYVPSGRLSQDLNSWYSWSSTDVYEKVPIRLEAPPGKRLMVIDATDTGELVAWARIPHRVGSESYTTTGEVNASLKDNPDCTQAFTFTFVLAIKNDRGISRAALSQYKPIFSREEHREHFDLIGFPMFDGRSLFKYRRIISARGNPKFEGSPSFGDMTVVNWFHGNNWNLMNPPLLMGEARLIQTGQYLNWMGGMSATALQHGEDRALLFSEWLMEVQSKTNSQFPLAHLSGKDSPMGTLSGLSMMPYFREGRRIIGRKAYGQTNFMIREQDIRKDMTGGRNFQPTAIGVTHYDVDIQGCMYRNWVQPWEAQSAGTMEDKVKPVIIPLESLIPQGVDNLLIGGKAIAVTHIVNGVTRIHQGEWSIGGAAGATAGWILKQNKPKLTPAAIVPSKLMPKLHQYLRDQGLRFTWYQSR
ncbi:FAD-dependent oxidoreductase [Phormidium sp. LEGE 05292]|uniref:FAD-dependent oxidoreductase n=1 Tax=[Phormidium] sp. LEGE 05292 TaxID=767427 RepID=UPI001882DF0C|nr:FAD-dependent oxidoreductase [Phormidium sp. LEGE 05292]MBE9225144.1 FAD-dependent oxidoreductase [Phormidium sp. LEGE 05292]